MGIIETMFFGTLSVLGLAVAVSYLFSKKNMAALLSSTVSVLAMGAACYFWTITLQDSGKPTFLLGYERYPFVLYGVCGVILADLYCFVFSVAGHAAPKSRKTMGWTAAGAAVAYILVLGLIVMNNSIVGTWTGSGELDVPKVPFPLDHAVTLQFRANGTVTATTVSEDGTTTTETYSYDLTHDTIGVTKSKMNYAISFDVQGDQLLFGQDGAFAVYHRTN